MYQFDSNLCYGNELSSRPNFATIFWPFFATIFWPFFATIFRPNFATFFGRTLQHFSVNLSQFTRPNCSGISAELCNIFQPNFATFFGRTLQHFSVNLSQFTRLNCSGKITWILESFRNLPGRTVAVFSSLFWFLQQIYIKISYNRPLNKPHIPCAALGKERT